MKCPYCMEEIQDGAIKCRHCKSILTDFAAAQNASTNSPIPIEIRQELKNYDEFIFLLCLECGYEGQMGVIKKEIPWYLTWWVLLPILLTGIGTIPAILLGVWRGFSTRHRVVCPSCKNTLLQNKT